MIKKATVTAGLKFAIETLLKAKTMVPTAIAGAKAIKGKPRIPPSRVSKTIDPEAQTTTTNVPISSAKNFFWLIVREYKPRTMTEFEYS